MYHHYIFYKQLEFELSTFKDYHKFIEGYIETTLNEKKVVIDEMQREIDAIASNDPENNHPIWDLQDNEIAEAQDIKYEFATRFRLSLVIQLMSLVEKNLITLCEIKNDSIYKIDDLKGGTPFDKFLLFNKRNNYIDFKILEKEWNFIRDVYKFRNHLIHSGVGLNEADKYYKNIENISPSNFNLKFVGYRKEFVNDHFQDTKVKVFEIVLDQPSFVVNIIEQIVSIFKLLYKLK